MMMMLNQIRRAIAPLQLRVQLMITRGVVKRVDESGRLQRLQIQISEDELLDNVERVQQYGFASRPKVGAESVNLSVGGDLGHPTVVAVEDGKVRPKDLEDGDSCQYTASGARLALRESTKNLEAKIGKFRMENEEGEELITVLSDAVDEVITTVQAIVTARTSTLTGPQQLLNPADPFEARKAALEEVKARLDTFKV